MYVSSDANDIGPITPAHLLHGRIASLPHQNVLDDELDDPSYNDIAVRNVKVQALLLSYFGADGRWSI